MGHQAVDHARQAGRIESLPAALGLGQSVGDDAQHHRVEAQAAVAAGDAGVAMNVAVMWAPDSDGPDQREMNNAKEST